MSYPFHVVTGHFVLHPLHFVSSRIVIRCSVQLCVRVVSLPPKNALELIACVLKKSEGNE